MTSEDSTPPLAAPRFLPLLFLLFVGSGCAALIYEIIWFQLLQFVIGSSAVSLAVLLGTFMGGMCLGSLVLPRWVPAGRHPLRVYAMLEFGIGAAGLIVLFAMPAVGNLYTQLVGHGLPGLLLRAVVCAGCLLPPTVMMGATLPAIARWVRSTPRGISWLGFFYGGNTLGAVGGCLLAGFYLLRVHDLAVATFSAVALNVTVALAALAIAGFARHEPEPPVPGLADSISPDTRWVLVSIALSGLCALAAEVIWTRILSLLLGATVYTFSIILAVFLTGLGFGSGVGSALARNLTQPRLGLAACQLLQAATTAWAAHAMAAFLPYLRIDAALQAGPVVRFEIDLLRCAFAILPAAILWGASFPLALAAAVQPGRDAARLVGRAYAANTVGAIAGALAAALLLIPVLGTQDSQRLLLGLALVAALFACPPNTVPRLGAALGAVAATLALGFTLPKVPWQLVAYGRQIATSDYKAKLIYLGEGMNASVAVSETPGGSRFFHVSGKTEASSLLKDMRLQRLLGHLPALLHPRPRSVLIVGCGAGVTAGSFVLHPSIERIVICDIEPLIPRAVADHFRPENYDVLRDRRVEVVHDDARHFIATTREKFDLITSDPIHPWVKGSAVLYSQEYFALCRQRLNPGGLMTQWVPFYEADRAVVQSEIATFFSVFPQGTIWGNDDEGFGYDTVMLGPAAPLQIDLDRLQERFERPDHLAVKRSLDPLTFGSAVELLSTYAGRAAELKGWLTGAEINRDRSLRLQYLAGLQLNSSDGTSAYGEMLSYRSFPADIFHASERRLDALRQLMESMKINP